MTTLQGTHILSWLTQADSAHLLFNDLFVDGSHADEIGFVFEIALKFGILQVYNLHELLAWAESRLFYRFWWKLHIQCYYFE